MAKQGIVDEIPPDVDTSPEPKNDEVHGEVPLSVELMSEEEAAAIDALTVQESEDES